MRVDLENGHDAARLAKGEGPEENSIDHTKNGRGCTDTESEGKNRQGSEAGGLAQHAEGEAEVLEQSFEERKAASFAMLLFGLLRAAETKQGLPARFSRRKAAAEIFLDGEFQMRRHFHVEVAVELSATKEREQPLERLPEAIHHLLRLLSTFEVALSPAA